MDALKQAEIRRDTGINAAEAHANHSHADWSAQAYSFLFEHCELVKSTGIKTFIVEDVREYARERGFSSPTDERAWGGIVKRAARNGLIMRIGYCPAKSSNLSPKCLWAAL